MECLIEKDVRGNSGDMLQSFIPSFFGETEKDHGTAEYIRKAGRYLSLDF
jgi:hypothetical protein